MKIKGVESIVGPDANLGNFSLTINSNILEVMESIKRLNNLNSIAMIPYCIPCRAPLDWFVDQVHAEGQLAFRCPKCQREWRIHWVESVSKKCYNQPMVECECESKENNLE